MARGFFRGRAAAAPFASVVLDYLCYRPMARAAHTASSYQLHAQRAAVRLYNLRARLRIRDLARCIAGARNASERQLCLDQGPQAFQYSGNSDCRVTSGDELVLG